MASESLGETLGSKHILRFPPLGFDGSGGTTGPKSSQKLSLTSSFRQAGKRLPRLAILIVSGRRGNRTLRGSAELLFSALGHRENIAAAYSLPLTRVHNRSSGYELMTAGRA